MYTYLANRLAIAPVDFSSWFDPIIIDPPAFLFQHSQPVSVEGFNAARYDAVAYHFSKGAGLDKEGDVYIDLQASNDLENWITLIDADPIGGIIVTTEGHYNSDTFEGDISFAYVRLQYRVWMTAPAFMAGPSNCVLSTGIELVDE